MNEKLCEICPPKIKGYCCYLNANFGEFNIILENVPCPHLDLETKLCKIYDKRKELAPHCLGAEESIGTGGLPKGCLYLKGKEHLESHPKVFIKDIIDKLKPIHIAIFNTVNNIPFEEFVHIPEGRIKNGIHN